VTAAAGPPPSQRGELLDELVLRGHLIPSGVPGVYGRGETCETVHRQVDVLISTAAEGDGAEQLRFPPILPDRVLDETGYVGNFPHLCGVVVGLDVAERQRSVTPLADGGGGPHEHTGLALLPAACHPAYPAIARRGVVPRDGLTLDLGAACVFRNEPSPDPARLQVFHQRELVRIGAEEQVLEWRGRWIERAAEILGSLELDASFEIATDPFFGRSGRLLAEGQRAATLKYEALLPVGRGSPVAVASFNHHRDHFGRVFGLLRPEGDVAYAACVGFGLERIAIALFARHGCDLATWPPEVRQTLRLEDTR
jgi:seryl-tRNA synthetase